MPQKSLVAMIALSEPEFGGLERLGDALSRDRGELPAIDAQRRGEVLSFQLGPDKVVVTAIDQPIPWADLAGPCRAAWYWPEASNRLKNHRAHLLVVVVPAGANRKSAALKLTKVAAALVEVSPAVAVFWGGSGTVHAPQHFCTTAREAAPDRLPIEIWVGFGLVAEEDSTHSLFTSGLEEFGFREMEVHHSPADPQFLYQRLFDMVHYVLRSESMLHGGETIGVTESEVIEIHSARSLCDGTTDVLELRM